MSGLCNFRSAFSIGGDGFFCIRCLFCFLWMIKSHWYMEFWICFWSLLIGFFRIVSILFSERNVCTLLEYSSLYITTMVLLSSAGVIVAFSVVIL